MKHWRFFALVLITMLGAGAPAYSQTFVFIYPEIDGNTNDGFDDPTPVMSDITGLATTLGADRRAAFEAAAATWAPFLDVTVPIRIRATFSSQGGSSSGAPLGAAGPERVFANFPGRPLPDTWFASAQADQLQGSDIDPSIPDITTDFNQDVDGTFVLGSSTWYYGVDGNPPPGDLDFFSTVLHEIGHGLGFLVVYNLNTGALAGGFPSMYLRRLVEPTTTPSTMATMANFQRLSAQVSGNVFWVGTAAVAEFGSAVPMFAPNPVQLGSSISHWDTSLFPNELMEPFKTVPILTPGLEIAAFEDLLWPLQGGGDPSPPPAIPPGAPVGGATGLALLAILLAAFGFAMLRQRGPAA